MPSPVRFGVIRELLERHNWILHHVRGSHHIFKKEGVGTFPVPVHKGQVKHGYYRKAKKLCGE